MKSALLAIHRQHVANSHVHSNGLLCEVSESDLDGGQASPWQQDTARRDTEYDEEEWASGSSCGGGGGFALSSFMRLWRLHECVCVCVFRTRPGPTWPRASTASSPWSTACRSARSDPGS